MDLLAIVKIQTTEAAQEQSIPMRNHFFNMSRHRIQQLKPGSVGCTCLQAKETGIGGGKEE